MHDLSIQVDRAMFELRCGRAVKIDGEAFIHPEFLHQKNWQQVLAHNPKLIVTKKRAEAIFAENKFAENKFDLVVIDLSNFELEEISLLVEGSKKLENSFASNAASETNKSAILLARLAQFLPTMVLLDKQFPAEIALTSTAIFAYKATQINSLQMVAETPLKLANAKKAHIKAFRPQNGGSEHLAIIIGDISEQPLVRLHSSCYTGDLLGSLACDCGDQLRECIKLMDAEGGGIIVYLLQEGRGIGLINKLRAYQLQKNGLDTVQANEFLGFDDEEREFEAAAKILTELGVSKARLVSNNPRKAADLVALGIDVAGLVPLVFVHQHNHNYLQTKAKKSGHLINKN